MAQVWVYVECDEKSVPKKIGLELLAGGRDLARELGQPLSAVLIGSGLQRAAEECAAYGADEIISVDGPQYAAYETEPYTDALCALAKKYRPDMILMGATNNGRDFGPRQAPAGLP